MPFEYLFKTLKSSEVFKDVDGWTLEELIQNLKIKRVVKGTKIIKEGEKGDKFYIIKSGLVSVRKKKGFFGSKEIAKLYPGSCFGEMALIEDKPRNATVIAEEDSELFYLEKEAFDKIIMSDPDLKAKMEALCASRKACNT